MDKLGPEEKRIVETFLQNLSEEHIANHAMGSQLEEYKVVLDDKDKMGMGAPAPIFVADEHKVGITFYLISQNNDADISACFFIEDVYDFQHKSNVGGYDHQCVFAPFDYGNVWTKDLPDNTGIELVFGFHDSSMKCHCRKFKYSVCASEDAVEKIFDFVFPE
ncbi:MAG: hypothetical protein ABJN69_09420 [Hellea sp.]